MAEINPISPTIPDKSTGQQVSATEFTNLKNKVVQLVTFINNMFDSDHTLKTALLKESTLSPDQFETLGDGHIGLIGFENIGSGGPSLPKPSAPAVNYNSTTRILEFTHDTYPSSLEYRINGGSWTAYTNGADIAVGSSARAAGYWECRVKAVTDVNQASNITQSPVVASESSGDGLLMEGFAYVETGDVVAVSNSALELTAPGMVNYTAGDGEAYLRTSLIFKDGSEIACKIVASENGSFGPRNDTNIGGPTCGIGIDLNSAASVTTPTLFAHNSGTFYDDLPAGQIAVGDHIIGVYTAASSSIAWFKSSDAGTTRVPLNTSSLVKTGITNNVAHLCVAIYGYDGRSNSKINRLQYKNMD